MNMKTAPLGSDALDPRGAVCRTRGVRLKSIKKEGWYGQSIPHAVLHTFPIKDWEEHTPRCHAYFPASTTINVFVMWITFSRCPSWYHWTHGGHPFECFTKKSC